MTGGSCLRRNDGWVGVGMTGEGGAGVAGGSCLRRNDGLGAQG